MAALPLRRFTERLTYEPRRQDPYRTTAKHAGTPQCPTCKSFLIRGKWYPEEEAKTRFKSGKARRTDHSKFTCPACQQLKDHYAQGVVEIHGDAFREHRDAIEETIYNTELVARSRNDQQRILWTNSYRNVTKFYVTLPDLARQIGRVLVRSFKGKVEFHRSSEEYYLRVVWNSDPQSLRAPTRHAPIKRVQGRNSRQWRGRGARTSSSKGTDTTASKGKGRLKR